LDKIILSINICCEYHYKKQV